MTSNSADEIARLRRRIASNKGKAKRARATRERLLWAIESANAQVRFDQAQIIAMGGKVRK